MNPNINIVRRHIAEARNRVEHNPHEVNTAMLPVLAEMALLDIAPDGTFSDDECNTWSVLHDTITKAKAQAYHDVAYGKVKLI